MDTELDQTIEFFLRERMGADYDNYHKWSLNHLSLCWNLTVDESIDEYIKFLESYLEHK